MHICSFTDFADLTLETQGKVYRFEFSKRFGPFMLGKRGGIVDGLPPKRAPFWDALQAWVEQGYQVIDQRCVFVVARKPVYVTLAGRHIVEVPEGRNPKEYRREWFRKVGLPVPEDGPDDDEAQDAASSTA